MMVQPEDLCVGCMEPRTGLTCAQCGWEEGTPPSSPVFLRPRTVLDRRYLVGRVLGAGGFGITYLAWDLNLDFKLAIKEYFPNAFGARDRDHCTVIAANTQSKDAFDHGLAKFLEEGRSLAKFQGHPSIASVMTFFKENGTSYLVMKYEDGITLQQYLKEHGGHIDFEAVMGIAMPVLDALRAVHAEGILHRDISPDNILINRSRQIKILDFGSAKRDMTMQDRTLQITLKRGFSPEEQYRANGRQGPWTDVYAVGATLYQALTAVKPPDALERLNQDTLKSPSELGIRVPKNFEHGLMKALEVRAPDRFQTIQEFQEAIQIQPPHPPFLARLWEIIAPALANLRTMAGRYRRPLAGLGAAVLILAVLLRVLPGLLAVPEIQRFTAEPGNVSAGQPASLRWSVRGGKISIAPGIGRVSQASGSRQVSPAATTTYTLTVSGPLRSATRSVRVTVETAQNLVLKFSAEPLVIRQGASAELTWSVNGDATSVSIEPGIGKVKNSDSVKVSPASNTTYTLKAEGPGGVVKQESVTVLLEAPVPKPVIAGLSAEPPTIRRGQTAQLIWGVTGENAIVSFDQDIGKVALRGSQQVSPKTTTKYKLLARNPGGAVSKTVTIQVLQSDPPEIGSFTLAPPRIGFGQTSTLAWSVSGDVDNVSIAPGIGSVPREGSRPVSPNATTTYVISASGPGGAASNRAVTLQVAAPRTPEIRDFTVSPKIVGPRQPVIIHWAVTGDVDHVTLDPGAIPLKSEGSRVVEPTVSTRYTLTASGPSGSRSVVADVQVSNERFEIVLFEVTPLKIKRGQQVTISWRVTGPVTGLSINQIGNLPRTSGSIRVQPAQDTTFVLTAQAGNKFLTSRPMKVVVKK